MRTYPPNPCSSPDTRRADVASLTRSLVQKKRPRLASLSFLVSEINGVGKDNTRETTET